MIAKIQTLCLLGVEVMPVDVQVKITSGAGQFNIVGLPDKSVNESKERVRAAMTSCGFEWCYDRIIVNLAPADLQKEGNHFDLAIALGILVATNAIKQEMVENFFVLGELALDGTISKVNGMVSAAIGAKQKNYGIICPKINAKEVACVDDVMPIIAAPNLLLLVKHLKGEVALQRPIYQAPTHINQYPDLADVKGQQHAKRALEIAAAGNHNILMIGPPGTGKSMLASRLSGILPDLSNEEILAINMIHSASGRSADSFITSRPYRDPHHSCSMPAMVGGGAKAKPGEISLAHFGVLFLDELAEFPRQVLDSLRQPLETGNITIARANCHVTFPANFQLISAMNPCRCGYLGDAKKECKKAPICGSDYKGKISGPLLDRIDITVNVTPIDFFVENKTIGESSQAIKARVIATRELQKKRYENFSCATSLKTNAKIDGKILENFITLDEESKKILQNAVEKMSISMRGMTRILRVARTIADMDLQENINKSHLLEAIGYRRGI